MEVAILESSALVFVDMKPGWKSIVWGWDGMRPDALQRRSLVPPWPIQAILLDQLRGCPPWQGADGGGQCRSRKLNFSTRIHPKRLRGRCLGLGLVSGEIV